MMPKVTCRVCGRQVSPRPSGRNAGMPKEHRPYEAQMEILRQYNLKRYNRRRVCPGGLKRTEHWFFRLFPQHKTPNPYQVKSS